MNYSLHVGINEFADPGAALRGCINDVINGRQILMNNGWVPENIRMVCDARATRLNQFQRLDWLTKVAVPGDKVCIQWSCHGTQVVDRDGDEVEDRQDECLCSYDFPYLWDSPTSAPDAAACQALLGEVPKPEICDDNLAIFLRNFQKGVYVFLIADACHSGSIDRGIKPPGSKPNHPKFVSPPIDIEMRGRDRVTTKNTFGVRGTIGSGTNVHYIDQRHVLLSGCRDNQTSADAVEEGVPQGAMTWAWRTALNSVADKTWIKVHALMLDLLQKNGYDQVPQLTGPKDLLEGPVFGA